MQSDWVLLLELGRKRITVSELNTAIHNLRVSLVKRANAIGARK